METIKKYSWAVFWLLIQSSQKKLRISLVTVDHEPQQATMEPVPMKGCGTGVPRWLKRGNSHPYIHCLLGGKVDSVRVLALKHGIGDFLVR